MNKKFIFFICLTGIISLFMTGCHTKKHEKSDAEFSEEENYELQSGSALGDGFEVEALDNLREVISNKLLPASSGEDKKELNKIIKYLDEIREKDPAFFEDPHNIIKLVKTLIRGTNISAKLFPDDFDININVSLMYVNAALTIEQFEMSEDKKQLIEEYRKKGIQEAMDLVERFPDNGRSYGNLAWFYQMIIDDDGKADEKALELYKRCLDIDPELEYCRNGYNAMQEEIKN